MLASGIPTRFPIPWGNSAGGSYIRTIPEASQIGIQNGAASLTDGFPPLCFIPVSAGGTPPFGQDMNGILKQLTQWAQWQAAGAPQFWNSAFATGIGGYPQGAILASTSNDGTLYISTADGNLTDPDSGGSANWDLYLEKPTYVNSATAGSLNIPGTPFIFKWKTGTTAAPGVASDLFAQGYASTSTGSWNVAFPNACYAAFADYTLVSNGNCTFGLVEQTAAGYSLYTTSGQNTNAIPYIIFGFGW